jgi:hypothetical protein
LKDGDMSLADVLTFLNASGGGGERRVEEVAVCEETHKKPTTEGHALHFHAYIKYSKRLDWQVLPLSSTAAQERGTAGTLKQLCFRGRSGREYKPFVMVVGQTVEDKVRVLQYLMKEGRVNLRLTPATMQEWHQSKVGGGGANTRQGGGGDQDEWAQDAIEATRADGDAQAGIDAIEKSSPTDYLKYGQAIRKNLTALREESQKSGQTQKRGRAGNCTKNELPQNAISNPRMRVAFWVILAFGVLTKTRNAVG